MSATLCASIISSAAIIATALRTAQESPQQRCTSLNSSSVSFPVRIWLNLWLTITTAAILPQLIAAHALPGQKSSPGDQDDGNTGCLSWCRSNFRNPGADCVVPARSHGGPCFNCGPHAAKHKLRLKLRDGKKMTLCNERCCDANSDPEHCGACGNRCGSGSQCKDGRCVPKGGCKGGGAACGSGYPCGVCFTSLLGTVPLLIVAVVANSVLRAPAVPVEHVFVRELGWLLAMANA